MEYSVNMSVVRVPPLLQYIKIQQQQKEQANHYNSRLRYLFSYSVYNKFGERKKANFFVMYLESNFHSSGPTEKSMALGMLVLLSSSTAEV